MTAERKRQTAEQDPDENEEPFALRQQVAERLAAHRSRRPRSTESEPAADPRASKSRIAAAVAERYAQSKSYRAFLAEEAERAVREAEAAARQAEAAAEIAARNAEALAQVQYNLLAELDQYSESPAPDYPAPSRASGHRSAPSEESGVPFDFDPSPSPPPPPTFTVRHAEDLRLPTSVPAGSSYRNHRAEPNVADDPSEAQASDPFDFLFLDEEIAFRQSPVFDPVEPPVEIPGNLIEFPRQLVASRRARPRLAEGPLREEGEPHSDPSQLRIFEVEAEQISPEPAVDNAPPEWSSILLDAHPRSQTGSRYQKQTADRAEDSAESYATHPHAAQHLQLSDETRHLYAAPLVAAPLSLRVMSAAVDACVVLAAFLVFTAVSVLTVTHLDPGGMHITLPTAALSSAGIIVILGFLYQWLFFTYSNATLGMRYARIGLCTFSDDNPSHEAMRRRILALALSSASLGLGVLWALLDDEHLGWHDRISRMYQRSY